MKATANQQLTVDNVPASASFSDELKARIRRLLGRNDLSLRQLALQMEGAYPTDILAAIESLRSDGFQVTLLDDPPSSTHPTNDGSIELPEPHPLDFDWRFHDESLVLLSQLLADMKSEQIAILGAPTLFLHLAKAGIRTSLYDKNSHLVEGLQSLGLSSVTHCDLFEAHFERPGFDLVVADPPWYPEHYSAFIRSSAALLLPGGVLLLSVLPRMTRPSAAQDRMAVIREAFESGQDIIDIHPSALMYDSPPFERASLRAEGISLNDWRKGDLFVFRRSAAARQPPIDCVIENDSLWNSFAVGQTIVKVKNRQSTSSSIEFGALSPSGDVHLHSVSRRAPFRSNIDVWTSRNLAIWMSRPSCLCDVLSDHQQGHSFEDAIARAAQKWNLDSRNKAALGQVVSLLVEDAKVANNG